MLETSPVGPRASERKQPAREQAADRQVTARVWVARGMGVLVILLIASLPAIYAYQSQPADRVFTGIVFNVPDNAQYLSWLRDHRTALLVPNRMTPEPNEPLLFNTLWLLVARASVITGLSVPVIFHTLRLFVGAVLLLLLYPFCRLFTRSDGEQLTAYLTIAVGGGLGWVWVVDKYLQGLSDVRFPLDLYVAEPNLFFNILAFPHFVIAALLIVSIFWCFLAALRRRSWWCAAGAAALGLTLTLQHAYDLLIIGLVPAGALALIALRDRRIPWFGGWVLALIGAIATPPAAYFTLLTSRDPLWREILDQFSNAGVFTPPPHHLLILLGVPLIVALIGMLVGGLALFSPGARPLERLGALLTDASDSDLLLWSWLVIGFLLLYVPTDFQIHMLNTWQIPVALLAARVIYRQLLPPALPAGALAARAVPLIVLLLVLPTNLYLVGWRILDLSRHQAPYYLTSDQDAALDWLEQAAGRESVVLSGLQLGQFVPVRSDARTFRGHWAQTVAYYEKGRQVQAFFATNTADAERRALLQQYAITHVIYGGEERSMGSYDLARSPLLDPVFTSGDVTVYRVRGR